MLLNIRRKKKGISALEKKSAHRHFHAIWTLIEDFSWVSSFIRIANTEAQIYSSEANRRTATTVHTVVFGRRLSELEFTAFKD
jgi:hypothetical protein